MLKQNLSHSLKRTLVFLTLFTGCLGVHEVIAQDCPKGTIGLPAAIIATLKCQKWTYDFNSNNETELLNMFKTNCDNSYGSLTCYWNNPWVACKAKLKEYKFENPGTDKNKTKVLETPVAGIYNCSLYGPNDSRVGRKDPYPINTDIIFVPAVQPQPHCGIEVNGPYSNCSDQFVFCHTSYSEGQPGFGYTPTQTTRVKNVNRENHSDGKLHSDLAGFIYVRPPNEDCIELQNRNDPEICKEPELLINGPNKENSPEVHHVIPKKDRQGCSCGKNSMKNAVLISRQLNRVFFNFKRPDAEITAVNIAGQTPYPCQSQIVRPPNSTRNKMRKRLRE